MIKINKPNEVSLRELNQTIIYSPEKLHNKFIYFENTCVDYVIFKNNVYIIRFYKNKEYSIFINKNMLTYNFHKKTYIF